NSRSIKYMFTGKPLLSVLVPVYNAEKFVEEALSSILKQTYSNLEILICDDGSTDNTSQVLEKLNSDARIRIFQNQTNLGKNETCSFLLGKAKGEYVSVHDADDISLPIRFEKQMSFLLDHPEFALCGTNFICFTGYGKIIKRAKLNQ